MIDQTFRLECKGAHEAFEGISENISIMKDAIKYLEGRGVHASLEIEVDEDKMMKYLKENTCVKVVSDV